MQPIIPGAYEMRTSTLQQPDFSGGGGVGLVPVPVALSSMDEATTADRRLEGGGTSSAGGYRWLRALLSR